MIKKIGHVFLAFGLVGFAITFASDPTVCDPRPFGGHTCPANCLDGVCPFAAGGKVCNIPAGTEPGFCKIAATGTCAGPGCPGTCALGGGVCACDGESSGGYGPC